MLCVFSGCCSWVATFLKFGLLIAAIKIFLKLKTGRCKSSTSLVGKTAIVTGANTGIGYETAIDLVKRGARVILACRDKTKANEAAKRIIYETGADANQVLVKIVDYASLKSVRAFAEDINKTEPQLDILVNNAGAGGSGEGKTEDGLQLLMQINYFAPFLLTNLLLGLLKKSGASRIINVSSIAGKWSRTLNLNDMNDFPGDFKLYCNTKLCNILFTRELASKLKGTLVTTNSLHPGAVQTEIFRTMPPFMRTVTEFLSKIFFKTAREGAQTSIYLAVDKDVELISGEHFHDCKHVQRYKSANDTWLAKKLWAVSEEMVKLAPEEKQY